jgi:hypothetical protein
MMPCEMADFQCCYLGLPLAIRKLTKDQVQPNIDKITNQLPGWKADLMTKAGRKSISKQTVLTGMVIYFSHGSGSTGLGS